MTAIAIRPARPDDTELIIRFILELATYEKLEHEVKATAEDLGRELFGPSPKVFCEIAEWQGEPVGFALWFYTFSTFVGRHGIWLEDLFVRPAARSRGVGKALLRRLAARCLDERLGRLEWAVLDWNQPSIDFYRAQGAVLMADWERCRLDGEGLRRLGAS